MWSSPLFWIVIAIGLFWALGAYNRLMRLRSAVVQSFGSFDAHMVRMVALLGEFNASCTVQRDSASAPADQEIAALQGATTQLSASLAVARARPLRPDAIAALAAARDVLHASWPGALRKAQEVAAVAAAGASAGASAGAAGATAAAPAAATHAAPASAVVPAAAAADAAVDAAAPAVNPPAQPAEGAAPAGDSVHAQVWPVRWSDHLQQNDQAIAVFNDAVVQYNEAIAQFPANLLAWAFGFKAARRL